MIKTYEEYSKLIKPAEVKIVQSHMSFLMKKDEEKEDEDEEDQEDENTTS